MLTPLQLAPMNDTYEQVVRNDVQFLYRLSTMYSPFSWVYPRGPKSYGVVDEVGLAAREGLLASPVHLTQFGGHNSEPK